MNAKLILENGMEFEAKAFGCLKESVGEVVFNTAMTGYNEILTDPSYYGQMVVMTYPLIGNYGINIDDYESGKCHLKALIVREACDSPSNFRCEMSLDSYLKSQGVIGLHQLDTRALTKVIRDSGVMKAYIEISEEEEENWDFEDYSENFKMHQESKSYLSEDKEMTGFNFEKTDYKINFSDNKPVSLGNPLSINVLKIMNDFQNDDAAAYVGVENITSYEYKNLKEDQKNEISKNLHIGIWDFGVKNNILNEFSKRAGKITLIPHDASAEVIESLGLDLLFLSNGPGDPSSLGYVIDNLKKLIGTLPIVGICLGHQLLALSLGGTTKRLGFGHRGANHPVKDLENDMIYITSQNHGYYVDNLPPYTSITHINLNDETIEGLRCEKYNVFSVQFHPEACPGPSENSYIFDQFIKLTA